MIKDSDVAVVIGSPTVKKVYIRRTLQFTGFLRLFLPVPLLVALSSAAIGLENPIGFVADNVVVKQNDGSLFATGNVELKQGKNTLRADEVTYYRGQNKAIARGDVIHRDAAGTVTRANVMELDTEFSHILAETIISKFTNGAWMAADNGDRVTGDKGIFENSRFTPCNCDFINGEQPMWDIKASRTVRNEKTQTITHYNMRMDVMNVPVGYLPFLSHPDWTVRRRSGFLTPSFRFSTDLGFAPAVPYYHVIDQTSDLEITAHKYQHRGLGLKSTYRKYWDNTTLNANIFTGNVETYKKTRELVGAVDAQLSSTVGNGWNINTQLRRASQDTFMRRYRFGDDTSMNSTFSATRKIGSRYYEVKASDRQSMLSSGKDINEQTILPYVFYEKTSKGWRQNQRFRREISILHLDNDEGYDLARWNSTLTISEEIKMPLGIASYEGNVSANHYSLHNKPDDATSSLGDYTFATPSLAIGWRIPTALVSKSSTSTLEPQAKFIYVGGRDYTNIIPNRDSGDYRLDEANLFLLNRYQGYDYILPGARVDIGLSALMNDDLFGKVSSFLGVSRRLSGKASTGLIETTSDKYSDFIASLRLNPPNSFSLNWSGRFSSDKSALKESSTSITQSFGASSVHISHQQLEGSYFGIGHDREQLQLNYSHPLTGVGPISLSQTWDLAQNKQNPTVSSANLTWGSWQYSVSQEWGQVNGKTMGKKRSSTITWNGGKQDCLQLLIDIIDDPSRDRDVKGEQSINIRLNFKHLGSFSQSQISSLSSN